MTAQELDKELTALQAPGHETCKSCKYFTTHPWECTLTNDVTGPDSMICTKYKTGQAVTDRV